MAISTSQYEFSHGRKPRGHGSWWFRVTASNGDGSFTTDERSASGLLSEARRLVCRQMLAEVGGARKIVEVEVMP